MLIIHLWQLETVAIVHWFLICALLLGVHFTGWLCVPSDLNKDPTVWLDGARTPSNDQLSTYKILTNSKTDKLSSYDID